MSSQLFSHVRSQLPPPHVTPLQVSEPQVPLHVEPLQVSLFPQSPNLPRMPPTRAADRPFSNLVFVALSRKGALLIAFFGLKTKS
ncbi:MAG TPA: hypothetical protein VNG69_15120 [Casimicrobiaceae bacterium]|nr:hypothetical protein [Casimicrobiaceae bacterium]